MDGGEGANILPSNLMSMSSDESTDKPDTDKAKGKASSENRDWFLPTLEPAQKTAADDSKALADDPLGLGPDATRSKGK